MRIHWIQHIDFETLGNINEWVANNNHTLSCTKQYKGNKLPAIDNFDMLIVMGGPMGVYDTDEYPWLAGELQFIKQTIELNKPVLGICLGAQFIASALGSKVYPGPTKEIGWFPLEVKNLKKLPFSNTPPVVFHWHGDTFDLPNGAELLASTAEVPHQAFSYKNTIGLQFHIEQNEKTIEQMLGNCKSEILAGGTKVQTAETIRNEKSFFKENKKVMFKILDNMEKLI